MIRDEVDEDEEQEEGQAANWADAYGQNGHLARGQAFTMHNVNGKTVTIYLARSDKTIFTDRENNFYFKHILHAPKKSGTLDDKHKRRLIKRNLTNKQKKDQKVPQKATEGQWKGKAHKGSTQAGHVPWATKYGLERGIEDNTAIDTTQLSLVEFQRVLVDALKDAPTGGTDKQIGSVKLVFSVPCVVRVNGAAVSHMWVEFEKVETADHVYYDVYHFAYNKQ